MKALQLGGAPPLGRRLLGGAARQSCRLPTRRPSALQPRRAVLRCTAHGGHGHSHAHGEEEHTHSHSCDHSHDHPHDHEHSCSGDHAGHSCGHDHGGTADLQNPVHRLLKRGYDAVGLTKAAGWLESSVPASIGKVALFLLAAAAAGYAASPSAAGAAAAVWAARLSAAATAGVYALAGPPAAASLSYDLTAGRVDTHVLMNLAVLGTLATGHALEGALLLVLFQTSHVVEHLLTDRAQGNLAALYDTMPKAATLVEMRGDGEGPDLGSARRVLAADVAVGALMLVKPGQQVPLDGQIVHGRAMVSSEHITGEALPVLRRGGDEVAAGSLNRDGLLVLRALRPAEDSTPARIARLTLDAQAKRPQLRTWLDKFGELYSKGVIAASLAMLAALLAAGVPLLGAAGQRGAFYRAMGLLTVASPCALVMVPLAYVSAIAAIASRGVLVKGGRVLDALARCSTVAFDKTGTLTTGTLACTSMRPLGAVSADGASTTRGNSTGALLGLSPAEATAAKKRAMGAAVALSLRSSHPVSDAVVAHGVEAGVDGSLEAVADFQLVAGGGVEGLVSSTPASSSSSSSSSASSSRRRAAPPPQRAAFGSLEFVSTRLTAGEVKAVERMAAGQGSSSVLSVLVLEPADASAGEPGPSGPSFGSGNGSSSSGGSGGAGSGRSVWVLAFEDTLRLQSAAAVRELRTGSWTGAPSQADRLAVTMLTGDNEASAARVARKLGITDVQAALSPAQKLAHVQQLSGRSQEDGSSLDAAAADAAAAAADAADAAAAAGTPPGKQQQRARGRREPRTRRVDSGKRRASGVIMVGDGINDAPALAAAEVGVAIASNATAAASLAADVIVVNSSGIAALPLMLRIARATQAVVRQNLILAAGSILALALPTVLGWVPLWFAVMLHEGSTLLVALNSLRLLAYGAPLRRWMQPGGDDAESLPAAAGARAAGSGSDEQGAPALAGVAAVPPAA